MKKIFILFCAMVFVIGAGTTAKADVTGFVDNPESNSIDWQTAVEASGGIVNTNVNFDSHPAELLQDGFYGTSEGVTLAIEPDSCAVVYGAGPGQGNAYSEPVSVGEGVHAESNYLRIGSGLISFTVTFTAPVYGAGLFVIDYFGPYGNAPLTISAYSQDGSLLGSYGSVQFNFQTNKQYFMGVASSDGDIASLVFTADTSSTSDVIGIDGIRFAAVGLSNQDDYGEGVGDVWNPDGDNDGVDDVDDNCPLVTNSEQIDADFDTLGDACDDNFDTGSVVDAMESECGSSIESLAQANPRGVNGMIRKLVGNGGICTKVAKAEEGYANFDISTAAYIDKLNGALDQLDGYDAQLEGKIAGDKIVTPEALELKTYSANMRTMITNLINNAMP